MGKVSLLNITSLIDVVRLRLRARAFLHSDSDNSMHGFLCDYMVVLTIISTLCIEGGNKITFLVKYLHLTWEIK